MGSHERRNAVALDDAYFYCRQLETNREHPNAYKLCNAIRTLDLALAECSESPMPVSLSFEAWSRVRDSLFNYLVSSVSGYFIVYCNQAGGPLEAGAEWPNGGGHLEFFPTKSNRKNDSYVGRLDSLRPSVLTPLRWKFAEGKQEISPEDFDREQQPAEQAQQHCQEEDAARDLLTRFNEVCEEQAHQGKKKAHRIWWQLYWEANSCPNRKAKHELEKQMVALQSIWGRPSED